MVALVQVRPGGVCSGILRQLWQRRVCSGEFRFCKAVVVICVEAARGRFRFCKAVKLTYGSGWSRRGKARVRCGKAVEASTIYKSI